HRGLLAVAGLERPAGGLERGAFGVRRPPRRRADERGGDLRAERRLRRELLDERLAGLLRVHVRHRAQRQPRAHAVDDLVRGALDRARLEGDHRERRARPDLLVDREALLARERHALHQAGLALELGLVEWQLADARELALPRLRDLAVEARYVQLAVLALKVGDDPARDLHRVGHRAAPHAAVDRPLEALDLEVD